MDFVLKNCNKMTILKVKKPKQKRNTMSVQNIRLNWMDGGIVFIRFKQFLRQYASQTIQYNNTKLLKYH